MRHNEYTVKIGSELKTLIINTCYCIGYSGRNKEHILSHIKELMALGVPEPKEIPELYPMRKSSITQESVIDVLGDQTTGEVEIVLIFGESEDEIYVTVGSDHTDRALETVDIHKSKLVCDKPFATTVWSLQDVIDHWDDLELVSYIKEGNDWGLYQKSSVKSILPVNEIIRFLKNKNVILRNCIVFCGTVPLINGFKYANSYLMKIIDPVLENTISFQYQTNKL
ncbi:DUF2848 family protein [Saccharococcus caldoxylosilyticus]|jgi:hypothetical protein|uniref:DUF2848 family protein n=1 Tax=Saccharococcus caldoxylosilyticus TaxID=81408 RepID=UPI000319E3EF|nr:DUF2848 family protein [Parageobacillus caldoxylosilyticus]